MIDNPCLRPASLSDFMNETGMRQFGFYDDDTERKVAPLRELYHAEWKKRGFERSP